MKKIFKIKKNEKVKTVYLNGVRQLEGDDYGIKIILLYLRNL